MLGRSRPHSSGKSSHAHGDDPEVAPESNDDHDEEKRSPDQFRLERRPGTTQDGKQVIEHRDNYEHGRVEGAVLVETDEPSEQRNNDGKDDADYCGIRVVDVHVTPRGGGRLSVGGILS